FAGAPADLLPELALRRLGEAPDDEPLALEPFGEASGLRRLAGSVDSLEDDEERPRELSVHSAIVMTLRLLERPLREDLLPEGLELGELRLLLLDPELLERRQELLLGLAEPLDDELRERVDHLVSREVAGGDELVEASLGHERQARGLGDDRGRDA